MLHPPRLQRQVKSGWLGGIYRVIGLPACEIDCLLDGFDDGWSFTEGFLAIKRNLTVCGVKLNNITANFCNRYCEHHSC
jgi:hypothetical protein